MVDLAARPLPRKHSAMALATLLAVTYLVAGVSTVFTAPAIPGWYAGLAKPSFNPPNWIFGPVWTVLYTLMAIAAWLVWRRPDSAPRKAALRLFAAQLALNFGWSILFFHYHWIGIAFVEILTLWLTLLAATWFFFGLSRAAGWLMVLYLAWVSFASILNYAIWRSN